MKLVMLYYQGRKQLLNPARAFPAACGGVSEHNWDNKWIEDSSRQAARSFNFWVSVLMPKNNIPK